MNKRLMMWVLLVILTTSAPLAASAQALDILISGGSVYKHPAGTVVGIKQGKIAYLGSMANAKPLIGEDTQHIRAHGRALYPGFIELHGHLLDNVVFSRFACLLEPEKGDLGREVCREVVDKLEEGQWLIGHGAGLLFKDLSPYSPRQWLDRYFPDVPVVIAEPHSSLVWANTKAFELMMINNYSIDPVGGKILRDHNNEPTGVMLGAMAELTMEQAWRSHRVHLCGLIEEYVMSVVPLESNGVTTLGDAGNFWLYGGINFWKHLDDEGVLKIRVSVRPRLSPYKAINEQLEGLRLIFRNDLTSRLIINQVSVQVDGNYGLKTARVSGRYLPPYLNGEASGLFYFSPTELNAWLLRLSEIGYGAFFHAEGDEAIKAVLYSLENVRNMNNDSRYTLSNMKFIHPDFERMLVRLDVATTFYEAEHHEIPVIRDNLIEQGLRPVSLRRLHAAGVSVSLSSESYGNGQVMPLRRISEAMLDNQLGIASVSKAIDSYTIEPAKALGIDAITGSIVLGKSADLILLEQDLSKLAVEDIASVKVLMTMLQGEITYRDENQG